MPNIYGSGSGGSLIIKGGDSCNLAEVTDQNRLKIEVDFAPGAVPAFTYISLSLGDGINPIQIGTLGYSAPIPFSGKIKSWSIIETSPTPNTSSLEVRIFKDNVTSFPPVTEISGSKPIALNNQIVNMDNNLVDIWNRDININDALGFEVVSSNDIARKVQILIEVERDVVLPNSKPSIPTFASITIGDGEEPISEETIGYSAPLPFSGKIVGYSIASIIPQPQPGFIEVEILKNNVFSYPPTTVISGVNGIFLDNQVVRVDNNLLGKWDELNVSVNDVLGFKVKSTDNTLRKVMIIVHMERNI